jgi:stress-induced morphogen
MAIDTDQIKEKLEKAFKEAEILLEDYMGDGNHYRLEIKHSSFKDRSILEQHKMVYEALGDCVGNDLHAITISTRSK